ncbi:MAG TPA: hypothetical protein VFJ43_17165 [Bacteroidia bacterium]|nr:hypothetical protein [Bacteroidia bacterium]
MEETLSYPYRRFSSDIYAEGLLVLLEENNIPYEVVVEPEGVGSVFLGSSVIPGVVVMVRSEDAAKVNTLEKKNVPEKIQQIVSEENEQYDSVEPWWIVCGYITVLVFSPISLILGLHFMKAKRRQPDMTYHYAYNSGTRMHGKIIFWGGIFFLVLGICLTILLAYRGGIWESSSYVIRRFTKY